MFILNYNTKFKCDMNKMVLGNMNSLVFDHRSQEWAIFKSRFGQFCLVNDITEETDKAGAKRRGILLSALVEDTYRVARDLVFPTPLEETAYATLIKKLDEHLDTKRCGFVERYQFYKAEQRPGEDLNEWAARVRRLAQFCSFTSELEMALRDRFVLGLENAREKEKLFAENVSTLTFSEALKIAQSVRCARLAIHSGGSSAGAGASAEVFALSSAAAENKRQKCSVCGYYNHSKQQCKFVEYSCKKCGKKGHLNRVCRSKTKSANFLAEDTDDICEGIYDFFSIRSINGKPMQQTVRIDNEPVLCELDSGSAVSVLPADVYNKLFKQNHALHKCGVRLNCYDGSKIIPLGFVTLAVQFESNTKLLKLFVISTVGSQLPLLGRDFISMFDLHLCNYSCHHISDDTELLRMLRKKYSEVFSNELGTFKHYQIHLKIKQDAELKFFKPRTVPLALKPKVEEELKRLVDLGILEKIEFSNIATPIVPVLRADGNVRICGDYSITLNKILFIDNYPLPRIEDLFSKLHGGVEFSKLDLTRAYNQFLLDEPSRNLTCINTHKGLFRYTRLVFGLSNAPCIFQQSMDKLLAGIEGTCIFLDDLLITAPDRKTHLERLEQVLNRLQDAGLRLKQEKCELFKQSVEYLGFVIDKNGLHKSTKKVDSILKCSQPKNVTELKSFLGMLNYYRAFIPGASSILSPLHLLLKKDCKWEWGSEQTEAFEVVKRELASDRVLAHYDPALRTVLTVDAGPGGLGAVLAQAQPGGGERAVAYASRSLSASEINYAQIQKEATAIIFGIKKFHHYLYGRSEPFILRTDHKPLISIFGSKKGVPELAANRLQRYALFLSAYNFKIEYIKSRDNVADFLSRAIEVSRIRSEDDNLLNDEALFINFMYKDISPITVDDIKRETVNDPILKKVSHCIIRGWPRNVTEPDLKIYFNCRSQLSLEKGCIMRGHKIIIPRVFRERLLNELHKSHFGVVKTKTIARKFMWWPNIDLNIEQKIGSCSSCMAIRCAPARAPLTPWPRPRAAWQRLHLDMAELAGRRLLVAVDAHSKWVECHLMSSTDSASIITKLCEMFARFGLVRTIVTDNATNFTSTVFKDFCRANGINHVTIAPYHPASNGQAENSVRTVKRAIKVILTQKIPESEVVNRINYFLFNYRNTAHCSTGFSPARLLLGRSLCSRFDLLKPLPDRLQDDPSVSTADDNVRFKQISQYRNYGGNRNIKFKIGDIVLVKSFYSNGNKHSWIKGTIQNKIGSSMFDVYIPELQVTRKKHIDQLLLYKGIQTSQDSSYEFDVPHLREREVGEEVPLINSERQRIDGDEEPSNNTTPTASPGSAFPGTDAVTNTVRDIHVDNVGSPTGSIMGSRRFPLRETRNPDPKY